MARLLPDFHGLLPRVSALIGFCIILGLTAAGTASEIDSQVAEIQNDIEGGQKSSRKLFGFGKDARLVPIPIPISDPTIVTLVYRLDGQIVDGRAPF